MGFVFKENPTFWYKTHQKKQFLKVCALGKKRISNKKKERMGCHCGAEGWSTEFQPTEF